MSTVARMAVIVAVCFAAFMFFGRFDAMNRIAFGIGGMAITWLYLTTFASGAIALKVTN